MDLFRRKPLPDKFGLPFAIGMQRRITMTINQRKWLPWSKRCRLAVAHEENLRRSGKRLEADLRMFLHGFLHGLFHGPKK